ncbi:uncharacterized protein BX664DRAFT_282456 [Halteromyces radiatus]|uniref:uncharacterized protein n=1 Tax=Halteromyces radiatus TaxID=101107 RepID=UPI00222016B8|nr:uncharacterized protein BX664DRAFT_282456 [Halteromyces radiatus]KAI8086488.1 hypothetical protein BX664DRAFT_282456 [Halteromyces radiatus]
MVSLLILGLGWSGTFLVELLEAQEQKEFSYVATTRDGRNNTITWSLGDDPSSVHVDTLPAADTVLVTFPVKDPAMMKALMVAYNEIQPTAQWILLSSTRPFTHPTNDRHSPLDISKDTGRMPAEQVLLERQGTVLHLAGLWGAQRQPKNWVSRFPTKDALKNKLLVRQLHLIHGKDVARAILAVHIGFKKNNAMGQRWIVTDGGCYDWLKLFSTWASSDQLETLQDLLDHDHQVQQIWGKGQTLNSLIEQSGILPRLDSHEFWQTFELQPKEFLSVV